MVVLVLIYVDDILITSDCPAFIEKFIARLNSVFAFKDMGPLHYYLRVEVHTTDDGMYLLQSKYISELLHHAGLSHLKSCPTPAVTGKRFSTFEREPMSNPTLYRSILGALQYLTHTRPDISYIVDKLNQYLQQPTEIHWMVVKRVLRYLKGTVEYGLFLPKSSYLQLVAYTDADWACNMDDRRLTTTH